jgi:hypothetical protein
LAFRSSSLQEIRVPALFVFLATSQHARQNPSIGQKYPPANLPTMLTAFLHFFERANRGPNIMRMWINEMQ